MIRVLCLAIGLTAALPAQAAPVFNFQGDPFDNFFGSPSFSGPVTGSITFAPMPLIAGSTLTNADVIDFSFEVNGFVFDLASSSFFFAEFVVDTPDRFSEYQFAAERELLDTGPGIEQITLQFNPSFSLQNFVAGDRFINSASSAADVSSRVSEFGSPASGFTPAVIPLPASAWLLATSLIGLGLMRRRRAE